MTKFIKKYNTTNDEILISSEEKEKHKNKHNDFSQLPKKIQMTNDFCIEYPLACRRDSSMLLKLKVGTEINDKYLIKHIVKNVDAPFIIKE